MYITIYHIYIFIYTSYIIYIYIIYIHIYIYIHHYISYEHCTRKMASLCKLFSMMDGLDGFVLTLGMIGATPRGSSRCSVQ